MCIRDRRQCMEHLLNHRRGVGKLGGNLRPLHALIQAKGVKQVGDRHQDRGGIADMAEGFGQAAQPRCV